MRTSLFVQLLVAALALTNAAACHSEPPVRSALPAPDPSLHPSSLASVELLEKQPPGVYAVPAYVMGVQPTTLLLTTPTPVAGQAVGPTLSLDSGGWGLEAFEVGAHYRFTVKVQAATGGGKPQIVLNGAIKDQ